MTLFDYEHGTEEEKKQWFDSFKITTGLKYFGGKAFIGRYLANHILNMAVKMNQNGHKADIFIDAFAGGGKIALSMPVGWFDKIVLNDYNYGVYNFFKCCQDEPEALVKMIEKIGPYMSEELFKFFLNVRSRADVKPLASAAMTYWVTQTSYNGRTDLEANYRLSTLNNQDETFTRENEKEEIQRIIKHAKTNIQLVHDRMMVLNVVVEHLDYRELIKKYNGKDYWDTSNLEDGVLDIYKIQKIGKIYIWIMRS